MLGKHHIIASLASVTILGTATLAFTQQPSTAPLGVLAPTSVKIIKYMSTNGAVVLLETGIVLINTILFWTASLLLLILGSLLPDIDNDNSLLGRHIHIGVRHRTWTHAVWGLLVLCLIGIYYRPMMWGAIGMFWHLFWDSLSVGGNCWFYPFSKYNDYSGGAHSKQHHWAKLYRVGGLAERIIVYALAAIAFACLVWLFHRVFMSDTPIINI